MMDAVAERWEQGSFPHLATLSEARDPAPARLPAWLRMGQLLGSGRVALTELLRFGHAVHGWRRLWVPSYYCADVLAVLARGPVAIARYSCGPWAAPEIPEGAAGDVLLRVSYFGWDAALPPVRFAGMVIEDHTHDPPAAERATGDYAFASLRKTLPLPDGGLLWSPRGLALPPRPIGAGTHDAAAALRLGAMALKRAYLAGSPVEKPLVRALELESEARLLDGAPAPISGWSRALMALLPFETLAGARCRNHEALRAALAGCPAITLLGPAEPAAPCVAVLQLAEPGLRDALRARLAEQRIYAAVLWPIPEPESADPRALDFSRSTLCLQIDGRYSPDDMTRVASAVRAAIAGLAS